MLRFRWLASTGIERFMRLDHPFSKVSGPKGPVLWFAPWKGAGALYDPVLLDILLE